MNRDGAVEESPQMTTLPSASTLLHATKLAMAEDKAIRLDYFLDTLTGKAFLGEDTPQERVLVKSPEEYTEAIEKIYKTGDEYILTTKDSLYIVSGKLVKRRIKGQ